MYVVTAVNKITNTENVSSPCFCPHFPRFLLNHFIPAKRENQPIILAGK